MNSLRYDLLSEAQTLICGDRNNQYGPPGQDFERIAGILNALGYRAESRKIESYDVSVIMIALKLSRLMWTPDKRDTWADIAGYAGCGFEVSQDDQEEDGCAGECTTCTPGSGERDLACGC